MYKLESEYWLIYLCMPIWQCYVCVGQDSQRPVVEHTNLIECKAAYWNFNFEGIVQVVYF